MWNDSMIREGVTIYRMVYTPDDRLNRFDRIKDAQFQPASLDVRLGPDLTRHPDGYLFHLGDGSSYTMSGGECLLASLVERIQLPNDVVARVEGKSSWARKFLTVHSAGFIDPGFHGDITLELKNDGHQPIVLSPGMMIAQISFQTMNHPAARPYGTFGLNSHYQDQKGPTQSCN